jgi:hypothetical protein
VAATTWHEKNSRYLVEKLFPLVKWPAEGHVSAIDDEAEIEHDVGYVRVPFFILKSDSLAIFAWHTKYKKGTEKALLEGSEYI